LPDRDAAFVGSVPENYDRYLGPLLFHRYADDLVGRLAVTPGLRVLETACGTGIVTEAIGGWGWGGWFRPLAAAPAPFLDGGQGRFKPDGFAIEPPEEEDKASGTNLRST